MSGGSFDYREFAFNEIADQIEHEIKINGKPKTAEELKEETLEEITKIICHTHKTPIEQANEIIELLQQQMYSEEEVDKMISDFKHDLIESTSNYVKQNCEGAIFGLSRLKNSKKK